MQDIRAEIDSIDQEVIQLLGRRFAYVQAAAQFKTSATSVRAPERFKAMLAQRRIWAQEAGLDPDVVGRHISRPGELLHRGRNEEMAGRGGVVCFVQWKPQAGDFRFLFCLDPNPNVRHLLVRVTGARVAVKCLWVVFSPFILRQACAELVEVLSTNGNVRSSLGTFSDSPRESVV